MMRTSLTLVLFFAATFFLTASAQDYKVAVGVRLSNATPTLSNAITVKYNMTEQHALEGIISFGSRFGLGGLYELHKPTTVTGLNWFYGGGAYVGFESGDTYLGPTGIIGLDYKFPGIPLNLSLDWKPELDIIPAINFVPDAFGFSARFT
ncbi:MAG TPA: hypothetical protein VD996_00425, partial [Chitinophagaceae bacterium]|nr:hypothetical protein [Chitinophagaceae bacterium]